MKRIYLHEPDVAIFEIISLILSEEGCEVKTLPYWDGDLATAVVSYAPDLIIMDCFQDLLRPARLCRVIRTLCPHTTLIASSCNPDIDLTYRKMGFNNYLRKPFDIARLTTMVNRYLPQTANC
ncbi:response regulator transcription factor [Pedobacter ghigonis]|uniref:response regulator transcription factor n=1 Tax=Pedobacter ghigonis TaxID=2730403 RepID=UPI00158AB551|nr:response regulator transcription factor [Pedobacter ghigonis]